MLLAWRMARTCGVSPTLPAAGTSKKRRKPYLDNAAKEEAQNVAITTQEQVDRAKASALSVAEKPPKYAKVVCEHCGHVMFIKEGDAVFSTEQS